jgi:hypothetical protein
MDFPMMLYRPDGEMLDWDGKKWDYIICADEEEVELARLDGFAPAGEKPKGKAEKPKPE